MKCKLQTQNVFHNAISPFESKDQGASGMAGDEKNESQENKNQGENVESEEEYVIPNHPPAPSAPSKEEWIKHQVTHVPFKAWCSICVKNAAANNPHKLTHHFRGVAMFCMDYMYMTKKPDEEQIMHPILVIKE